MDIRPLPGMTLNELNGLLNDALAPVSERWPGSSDGRRAASADPWL
ncbi:acetylornithine deacetylase [Escherichia coli]|uniref:Acetylornithine deacetylase n=1 Tax=Escherichia coli TaxID=562 RepID=A0A376U011_ECOLX|nr:acetylornithine deacetylase [Escherichia coli]